MKDPEAPPPNETYDEPMPEDPIYDSSDEESSESSSEIIEFIPESPVKRKRRKEAYSEPKRRKINRTESVPIDPSDLESSEEIQVLEPLMVNQTKEGN